MSDFGIWLLGGTDAEEFVTQPRPLVNSCLTLDSQSVDYKGQKFTDKGFQRF